MIREFVYFGSGPVRGLHCFVVPGRCSRLHKSISVHRSLSNRVAVQFGTRPLELILQLTEKTVKVQFSFFSDSEIRISQSPVAKYLVIEGSKVPIKVHHSGTNQNAC